MSKYVDVEVLKKMLPKPKDWKNWKDVATTINAVSATIDACPEGIVRCKDCRFCDSGIDEDGMPFLKCLGWVYGGTKEDDFCSHAERRNDG